MTKLNTAPVPPKQGKPPAAEAPASDENKTTEFALVKAETLTLPRAKALVLAQAHQTLPRSPTERELDPKRVLQLLERIKTGLLLPCCWATILYQNVKYRMNGQHSSQAMLDASDLLPEEVTIHLDHYAASSPAGMGTLFRQFDARFSGRSKQDVAGAYQGLVKALEGVSRRKGKLGIEGIGWYRRSIEALPVPSGDDLYQGFMTEAYHPFIRWLDKILSVKTPELERGPIIGAMYATFVSSESGAQEFWSHTAKNDLPDDSDPRSVLSAELVKAKTEKLTLAPAEFYAKCIKAWNAHRAGDKIRSLNVNPKKGLPEIAA